MGTAQQRIVIHREFKAEMQAVARGERPAPADAAQPSFNSVEALTRLLTPENPIGKLKPEKI